MERGQKQNETLMLGRQRMLRTEIGDGGGTGDLPRRRRGHPRASAKIRVPKFPRGRRRPQDGSLTPTAIGITLL
jgi:hypothetical protein